MELKQQLAQSIELVEYYNNSCAACRTKFKPTDNYVCRAVTNFPKRFSAFRCINLDEEDQHPFWEPKLESKKRKKLGAKNYARIRFQLDGK